VSSNRGSRSAALDQYQSLHLNSRIETADPHTLVALLYEELSRSLAVAERSRMVGRSTNMAYQLDRAQAILIALEASLDFDKGSGLAASLAAIYRGMRRELNRSQSLTAVITGVESLSMSWNAILKAH
jgi:flagellar secretion chaperone FliS